VVGDITVGNGATSDFQATSAKIYSATITPAAEGTVTVDIAAGVASDAAGNNNSAATQYSVINDETGPAIQSIRRCSPQEPIQPGFRQVLGQPACLPLTQHTNSDTVTWRIEFNEEWDSQADTFQIVGSSATATSIVGFVVAPNTDPTVFDLTYSGGDLSNLNGTVTFGLTPNHGIRDFAGNALTNTVPIGANENTFILDNTAPTLAVTGPAGPVSGAFTATFTFDEDVTGLVVGDISVGNGAASNFQATSATVYTATITPTADGAVTVDVAADVAADSAGNNNTAATQFSVTHDATAPTLAITGPAGPVSGTFTATFTFDEDVTGFVVGDISVGNGAASNFQATSASVYTATITPAADGDVTVDVAGSVATDAAGNDNTAATRFSVTNDAAAPAVAISGAPAVFSTLDPFDVTVTFSEPVLFFTDVGEVFAINGTASAPSGSDDTYTVTIIPNGTDDVQIGVIAGAALDLTLVNASEASPIVTITKNTTPPVVTLASISTSPVNGDIIISASFDEAVSGMESSDFVVTNGNASNFQQLTPSLYFIRITPIEDGEVTVNMPAGAARDGLGNQSAAAAQFSIEADITRPTLAITGPTGPVSGAFTATFTFDEDVSDFVLGDITVGNGAASNFQATSATVYTATITPAADGTVTVDVAGSVATDAAGNDNTAATQFSIINDAEAPTVASITRDTPSTEVTNADSLTWVVLFSENVTDIDMGDFAVSGTSGTVTSVSPQAVNLPPSVTGNGYSAPMVVSSSAFTVTASGGDLASYNGVVTLAFAGSQDITDEAGNALANTTPTGAHEGYRLDNTAPTATLSTTATAPVSGPFTLTATFSEDVTGFDVSDLSVTNGAASNFAATSATVYTATITPSASGAIAVVVPADAGSDAAGNGNTISTPLAIGHDPDRTLIVILPGVGSGTVTSSSAGIDCGADCSQDYTLGTSVTLTATADAGSSFASWTNGPCATSTDPTCAVTMSADTIVAARFTLDAPPAGRIVAATLPGARSGHVGGPVITALMSVVSRTSSPAQSCQIAAPAGAPIGLNYQQLDGAGAPTGPGNPLFDIDAGGSLNFVIAMTANAETDASGYEFMPVIACENASLDPIVGISSVLLTIGSAPSPDILSIAATPSNDGVIRIPTAGGVGFMTASAVNIGVGDGSAGANEISMTTTVDTGTANLPVTGEVCQIDQTTAACLTPRGPSVTGVVAQNTPVFFAVFVRDTSTGGIAFDPANARVFLRFADASGTIRSATSAAVTAPVPAAADDIASSLPTGRWSVLMRQPDGVWPGLARASLFIMEDGTAIIDDGTTPRMTTIEPIAADNDEGDSQGFFVSTRFNGLWTTMGSIRLGAPWADTTGEFWGVRDARSDATTNWTDLAGPFGNSLTLSETGEIRGNIEGCAVYGQASGPATQAVSLNLSGCAQSGTYLGLIDLAANDNTAPALLIANGTRGWRAGR
jgi:Bacterial Ig-like domain/Divergent InlB B-repeat domain